MDKYCKIKKEENNEENNIVMSDKIKKIQNNIWFEKYRPNSLKDLVGNKQAISKICDWIEDYKIKKKGTKPLLFITGPPGIGKTTVSHILLKSAGYEVIEYNASDIRSQKSVKENITKSLNSYNIGMMKDNIKRNIAIIMDEVDGMSSGDRGGISELINTTCKKVEYLNPIICISNNVSDKRLSELKKYCTEIYMNKPSEYDMMKVAKKIIHSEGIEIDDSCLQLLIINSQSDIRRLCCIMQELNSFMKDCKINLDNIEIFLDSFHRKINDIGPFDATDKLLSKYTDLESILKYYESDRSLVSMILHENVINHVSKKKETFNKKIEKLYDIYHHISLGDIVDKCIYNNQLWELQNYNGIIKCGIPSYLLSELKNNSYIGDRTEFTSLLSRSALQYSNYKNLINISKETGIKYTNIYWISNLLTYNLLIQNNENMYKDTIEIVKNIDNQTIEKMWKYNTFDSKENIKKLMTTKKRNRIKKDINA